MKIKKIVSVVLSTAALLAVFLWMQGYFYERVEPGITALAAGEAPSGPTVQVQELDQEQVETVVGTITSRKSTVLSAKIPAHIKLINVNAGDPVKSGDLLVVLDDADLQAKLAQARSGLSSAQANLENAEANYERHSKLLQDGAVTKAAFDNAEAGFRMARAGVQEAEKAIEELQVMLGYTRVTAPFSGVIEEKMAEIGQLSAPGMPLLSIQDPELIRLEAYVPETRRGGLAQGDKLLVRVDTLDRSFDGTISEIVPSADPRSRSFLVRVSLPPEPQLRTGMFARLLLPSTSRKILAIPFEAVRFAGQLEMVNVVKEGKVQTRMIRAGKRLDGMIEVLSGLAAGEDVMLPQGN